MSINFLNFFYNFINLILDQAKVIKQLDILLSKTKSEIPDLLAKNQKEKIEKAKKEEELK